MPSCFQTVALAAAVVLGLASDARAQNRSGVDRDSRPAKGDAAEPGPAPLADEAATTSRDATPSTDPFDAAASKVGGSGTRTGSDGESPGSSPGKLEKATFGAGCFWHVEHDFEWLPGVKSAVSGYSGGWVRNPSYEEVHEGMTGHAEVVQVEYDPSVITYEQLLKVFWSCHDPTQLNRQGPDIGTQYRSIILYHNEAQRRAALKSYRELTAARVFAGPIVTQLVPMKAFFRAEDYHQNYYGGKDDPRAAPAARSRRTRKAAAHVKTARVAQPGAAKTATPSAKRPHPGQAPPAGSQDHALTTKDQAR
ncbi:MAG TPA: peptide-methionine (S)-S-oxide reductase MsrA [Isosphaeraceae bacterium]|nr:peptide-methionine (S)-S-oxide reductase MsrA [Isosphaeraceae bacterium]